MEQPGSLTTYAYDTLERMVIADTNGNVTTYVYDSLNEITNVDTAGGVTTYIYDAGQLADIDAPGRRPRRTITSAGAAAIE